MAGLLLAHSNARAARGWVPARASSVPVAISNSSSYEPLAWALPLVWGGFCQGGAARVLSIFLCLSFFVRPGSPFFRPDPHIRIAGPRRSGQGWARVSAHRRLVVEGFEHDGTLERVGDDDVRGELRVGARSIVPHPCMRRAKSPNHDAGIRIGSKPRRRTHSYPRH